MYPNFGTVAISFKGLFMKAMHTPVRTLLLIIFMFMSIAGSSANTVEENTIAVPVKDMVTMVDLGAKSCIPCKMMAPILVELAKEYEGKAAIIFIDVWQQRDQAVKFKIKAIPTQIFFDKNGKEVERHTGFLDKKGIIERLRKLGVE